MAKKRTTKKKASRRGRGRGPVMNFHGQMVLFKWALGQFGVEDLGGFEKRYGVGPDHAGGIDEQTGLHHFFEQMASPVSQVRDGVELPVDVLERYERNILAHTRVMNESRLRHGQPAVVWKYYQYLSLVFTELFLDRYFADAGALRAELNEAIRLHNAQLDGPSHPDWLEVFRTEPVAGDDGDARRQLSRLAFWCATGSGKTLLMHVHIRQFRQYHAAAYRGGAWPALDQVIVVTPNDGLSAQHVEELSWSGLDAVGLGETGAGAGGLFAADARRAVKVLSIHKFREEQGQQTVATEAFAGCNLVLVDEGHRGAGSGSDGAWMSRRNELADGGFTFEYSATFKEAIAGDEAQRNEYARSILFDYSYRGFYRDGYGKDFTILNLEDDQDASYQRRYLTMSLLLFYQQMKVWLDGGEKLGPYLIDKPLFVFVGHTVTGGKKLTVDDKASVSDVVEVLVFLKWFLSRPVEAKGLIEALLTDGFTDDRSRDMLDGRLSYLTDRTGDRAALASEVHAGLLADVFHASGGGELKVQLLKEAAGELALRVGEGRPFGVVNVGEPGAVATACEGAGIVKLEDDAHRKSLFTGINHADSPVNLLVGSRKFTEGWNSWRVSSIGLMRMGKGEGTQVIQLFGRGVRLRGYGMSLRRSSVMGGVLPTKPAGLRCVETLQVFGVKAAYLQKFRDWIYEEVPEALERGVWELPVVKTLPEGRTLRTLRLRGEIEGVKVKGGEAFGKLGPLVVLRPPDETSREDDWLRQHRARLNWLPRVRGLQGADKQIGGVQAAVVELPTQTLRAIPMLFFDVDALLFGLEGFKAARGLDRLHVDRRAVEALLCRDDWYTLHADAQDMRLDRHENRDTWQRMAQQLLNAYAERFYKFVRKRWEAPYLEVAEVTEQDDNMIGPYTVETTGLVQSADEVDRIAGFVKELTEKVNQEPLATWSQLRGRWTTMPFAGHLYQPLLYVGKDAEVRLSPVALNKGEADFVKHLASWCDAHPGKEVHLLRNQSVTGLGFFQASNFFPDFLMWVQGDGREHLVFVDPKGLRQVPFSDPKVQFAAREIPRLQEVVARQADDLSLHAFILSNTAYSELGWSDGEGRLMSKADVERLGVLFQDDGPMVYVESMMQTVTGASIGS